MQLFEYYRRETNDKIECLEGRWDWKIEGKRLEFQEKYRLEEDIKWEIKIEWIDLFGKESNTIFTYETPIKSRCSFEWKFLPFNRQYGLISFQDLEQRPPIHLFWPIKFCWQSGTCKIGENSFEIKEDLNRFEKWYAILDKQTPSRPNELLLLFYSFNYPTHVYCRLDTKTMQIEQLGSYELSPKSFDCLCLNGLVVYGLDTESKSIRRFDMEKEKHLMEIKVEGLPLEEEIRCVSGQQLIDESQGILRTAGVWSSDCRQLFIWTEFKEQNDDEDLYWEILRSIVYRISLDDGTCIPLDHIFHQAIGRLAISPDNKTLYVRNEEYIGNGWRRPDGVFEEEENAVRRPPVIVYHSYRLSIGQPESLLFLAAATALSKPQSLEIAKNVLDKSEEEIPMKVYEQVEY